MKVKVQQVDGEVFIASNGDHEVKLGRGDCFRPMEMVLASIASCAGIDIQIILKKQKIEWSTFTVHVEGERDEVNVPSVFTNIQLDFRFTGENLPLSKLKRAISLSIEKYCSVAAMLNSEVIIKTCLTLNNVSYEL
ncbi:MAG: OsmC family protein [Flavobacteriales bacterium]